ncbi:unnamed protein product [Peniophora sp. CBMAI 1063]|nr:unnamed protein product [Peniophora sp. CBMAI 1063]
MRRGIDKLTGPIKHIRTRGERPDRASHFATAEPRSSAPPSSNSIPPREASGAESGSTSNGRPVASEDVKTNSVVQEDALVDLWNDALLKYKTTTAIDLTDPTSPLYRSLANCFSHHAILSALNGLINKFTAYRDPSPNSSGTRIRAALGRVVRAVLRAGVIDVGGETAAALAIPGGKAIFVALGALLQATEGVTDRFDAVLLLLHNLESYMVRLDVRLNAPLVPAAREHTVKILVEMLDTFAMATRMMRRNRARHFMTVLTGGGQDVKAAIGRFEGLMVEDTRLSLAEVHIGIQTLSTSLQTGFDEVKTEVAQHLEVATSDIVTRVTARLQASGIFELAHRFEAFSASWDEWKLQMARKSLDDDDDMRPRTRMISLDEEKAGFVSVSQSRILVPAKLFTGPTVLRASVSNMLALFQDLTPADQASLREAIAVIYSLAASVAGSNSDTAWCAAVYNPGMFISAFLPLAVAYVALFLCWRHMRISSSPGITRALQDCDPYRDTLVIIDVLGLHMVLPIGRCSSWADVHALLLGRFANKDGSSYVKSRSYVLMNAAGHPESEIVSPSSWTQTIRAGMTLEMSIVVRQAFDSVRCPWCEVVAPEGEVDSLLQCRGCRRFFRASSTSLVPADEHVDQSAVGNTGSHIERDPDRTGAVTVDPHLRHDQADNNANQAGATKEQLSLFRRIIVELMHERERAPLNEGQTFPAGQLAPKEHSSTPGSASDPGASTLPFWDDEELSDTEPYDMDVLQAAMDEWDIFAATVKLSEVEGETPYERMGRFKEEVKLAMKRGASH